MTLAELLDEILAATEAGEPPDAVTLQEIRSYRNRASDQAAHARAARSADIGARIRGAGKPIIDTGVMQLCYLASKVHTTTQASTVRPRQNAEPADGAP